jgi:hypothetical protein
MFSWSLKHMTKTSPLLLLVALAISACGSDAREGNVGAGNAIAVEAPDRPSVGGPAASSPPALDSPSGAASASKPADISALPLRPLSEEDLISTRQTGCSCMFDSRNSTYVQAIGDELMVRTPAGRQVCRVTDAQFKSLGKPDSIVVCGGVRVSIRESGPRTLDPEADSSDAPATLSAAQGGAEGRLDGTWGCAC